MAHAGGHHRARAVGRITAYQNLPAGAGGAGGADRGGDHPPGALARAGLPGAQPHPGDHRCAARGADRGRQWRESLAQDLFTGDLAVPVGGALLGVPVDRAQQRVDVDEHPLIGTGQQIDPPAQRHQMLAQHRLELTGVTEGELPQQRSHRRGCVHATEHGLHTARAQHVDVVNAVRSSAHPRDQRPQFRCRVRRPGLDPGYGDTHLLREKLHQPGLLGQSHHRHQPGTRHKTVLVEHR